MDAHSAQIGLIGLPLVLLAAAVVSVPIARFGRLSAIVAYLLAGVVIGPYGLKIFDRPEHILTVAELGVVMLLFVIGLELEFSRLLAMRRDIFGLGVAQLLLTAGAIGALALLTGLFNWRGALVASIALALSATAIALRILEDRGHLQQTYGQRAFAILLSQDISFVPLLALVPLLAAPGTAHSKLGLAETAGNAALIVGAIAALVVAGRYLLNPFFRLLAGTGAREVMTAAALLVVLGAALLMQAVGMSMALGAFLAGVLLAESNYRHQLEADIEPFRGLLLALFFMGVGMTIDLKIVWANLWLILTAAVVITLLKAGVVWALFRITCTQSSDALRAGSVLTGAGEFAFVLLPLGVSLGILSATQGSVLSAIAAITLLIGPPFATLTEACCIGLPGATSVRPTTSTGERLGAGDRLWPFRADRVAISASRGRRRYDHRPRSRDDPCRRPLRLQGLLRRRHPARRAARGRSRAGAADRDLHRQGGASQPYRRSHPRRFPGTKSSRAPTIAATRCNCSPRMSTTSCARPSNPRCASVARRWWRSASRRSCSDRGGFYSHPRSRPPCRAAGGRHLWWARHAAHPADAGPAERGAARRASVEHGGRGADRGYGRVRRSRQGVQSCVRSQGEHGQQNRSHRSHASSALAPTPYSAAKPRK